MEEVITERLLIARQSPDIVLKALLSRPNPPDPLEAVFALTTVAADLVDWHEPELQQLAGRCFEHATLIICELWAEGYRLEHPGPTPRPFSTTEDG